MEGAAQPPAGPPQPGTSPRRGPRAATALLLSCHPGPTVAVTAFSLALAVAARRDARGLVLVPLAVLSGQLAIGWCNDLLDRERDRRAGRTDKPLAAGAVSPRTVACALAAAGAACVVLSLATGLLAGAVHLVAVAAGLLYDLVLKRTPASVLPYLVAFGLLPAFVTLGLPGRPWPAAWVVVTCAVLGAGAHMLNVVPDVEADRAEGVLGLPQRLGARGARVAGAGLLAVGAAVLLLAPARHTGALRAGVATAGAVGALLLAGVAGLGGRRAGSRAPFVAAVAAAALDVVVLLSGGASLS